MSIRWIILPIILSVTGAFIYGLSWLSSEPVRAEKMVANEYDFSAQKNESMTLDEAKRYIDEQSNLEVIPKTLWKSLLPSDVYHILWNKGTERAFTGDLLDNKRKGTYVTAGCKIPVFHSSHKYDSKTGWPSFWEVGEQGNVILKEDRSWGMSRIEVLSRCGEHLGHVFKDGPAPTGLRYCINSKALEFIPDPQ